MRKIHNVTIIGMGALGLLYGTHIAEHAGRDRVRFVADGQRVEGYRTCHFSVNDCPQNFLLTENTKASPADLLIVAVKGTALQNALDVMETSVGPDTIIMSVLNGISSEDMIAGRYGLEHIIHTVAQGMDAMKFGSDLHYTQMGKLHIGLVPGEKQENLDAVKLFFDSIHMPYVHEDNILYRMWSKFMLNVGINQTCMAYETNYRGALTPGEANDTLIGAMKEVIALGKKVGIPFTGAEVDEYIALLKTLTPEGVPSMRQDGIAHRPSEVELFAGTVISMAEKYGIPVPVNRMLYEKVKKLEAGYGC